MKDPRVVKLAFDHPGAAEAFRQALAKGEVKYKTPQGWIDILPGFEKPDPHSESEPDRG